MRRARGKGETLKGGKSKAQKGVREGRKEGDGKWWGEEERES